MEGQSKRSRFRQVLTSSLLHKRMGFYQMTETCFFQAVCLFTNKLLLSFWAKIAKFQKCCHRKSVNFEIVPYVKNNFSCKRDITFGQSKLHMYARSEEIYYFYCVYQLNFKRKGRWSCLEPNRTIDTIPIYTIDRSINANKYYMSVTDIGGDIGRIYTTGVCPPSAKITGSLEHTVVTR